MSRRANKQNRAASERSARGFESMLATMGSSPLAKAIPPKWVVVARSEGEKIIRAEAKRKRRSERGF